MLRLIPSFIWQDELGLQRDRLLDVLGVHQAVGKGECIGDIALGIAHRLFADILGAGLHRLRVPLELGHCLLGRAHEGVERHPSLLHALFGHGAQIGGDLEVGNSVLVVHEVLSMKCPLKVL
jgi:hypothetical protein